MDRVDFIEGAGVGYSANLRVSSWWDHSKGAASFSFFGDAKLNATGNCVVSRGRFSKGSRLTQDDHCTNRERNEINQQIGWLGGGGYSQHIQQQETEGSVHPGITKQVQFTEPAETPRRDEESEPNGQI